MSPTTALVEPRLRLDSSGTRRTLLDGGWWPRSTDPVAELPGLVVAIDAVHGPITRLLLNPSTWDTHPRRLPVRDRVLRLAYFVSQPAALLTALCDNGARVDLLVVPADTASDVADAAMTVAASSVNRVHAQLIVQAVVADQLSAATRLREQAWEGEGGGRMTHQPPVVGGGRDSIGVTAHDYDR